MEKTGLASASAAWYLCMVCMDRVNTGMDVWTRVWREKNPFFGYSMLCYAMLCSLPQFL